MLLERARVQPEVIREKGGHDGLYTTDTDRGAVQLGMLGRIVAPWTE